MTRRLITWLIRPSVLAILAEHERDQRIARRAMQDTATQIVLPYREAVSSEPSVTR
jgi:hypothetical protein